MKTTDLVSRSSSWAKPSSRHIHLLLVAFVALHLNACAARLGTDQQPGRSEFHKVADAQLSAQVRGELLDKLGSDALGIQPQVEAETATLWGQVRERSSQELAAEIALSVQGIKRVRNRIKLEKKAGDNRGVVRKSVEHGENELRDAATENRVGVALLGELGRHALGIEVESTDGVVSLRGLVPDQERKERALNTAEETAGVDKVIDLLKIS